MPNCEGCEIVSLTHSIRKRNIKLNSVLQPRTAGDGRTLLQCMDIGVPPLQDFTFHLQYRSIIRPPRVNGCNRFFPANGKSFEYFQLALTPSINYSLDTTTCLSYKIDFRG